MPSLIVSQKTTEALRAFVSERCPRALEDAEFLPSLIVIIESEVQAVTRAERAAARETCWRFIRKAGVPCRE